MIGNPARAFLVVVQLDVHAVMDLVVVQGDMVLVDRVPNSPHNEKKGGLVKTAVINCAILLGCEGHLDREGKKVEGGKVGDGTTS